jgi:hypothetical protein
VALFQGRLDGKDNNIRRGVKTDEKIVIALYKLGDESTFMKTSNAWQRGKTTVWECMYNVC